MAADLDYALYATPGIAGHYVARTVSGEWVLVPDIERGWDGRRPYDGHLTGLRRVPPQQARLAVERLDAAFDLLRREIARDDIATVRGGRREGAGRKPSPHPLQRLSVRLAAEEIAYLREVGQGNTSEGIRELVRRDRHPA